MEKLSVPQMEAIEDEYGQLPEEYFAWLSEQGWGEQENGIMLYSGPVRAREIFGDEYPKVLKNVLLIGDDMAGYSLGYRHTNHGWQFVDFDSAVSDLEIVEEGLRAYLKS